MEELAAPWPLASGQRGGERGVRASQPQLRRQRVNGTIIGTRRR